MSVWGKGEQGGIARELRGWGVRLVACSSRPLPWPAGILRETSSKVGARVLSFPGKDLSRFAE